MEDNTINVYGASKTMPQKRAFATNFGILYR